ncbi:MAG: MFS transporter [Myxococcaceae bacterium]|nr:MAG: MFS transporter [Myxococcaceae bacterium]
MVAPLIPRLAAAFHVPDERIGLVVPAYLIPYGVATLVYGVLSDRVGRRRLILGSLGAFVVLTAATATAQSATQLLLWRLATGLGASAVVPLSLALLGALYPFAQRGRPLGWIFGAMAGGAAFGSTLGVVLAPLLGWRGLFAGVSALGAVALGALLPLRHLLGEPAPASAPRQSPRELLAFYGTLLGSARGGRTYAYVFLNAVFHGGVFTWLGVYFARRYHLGDTAIGLALLGYGIPGFLLGPAIGRVADRHGRRRLIPAGVALAALSAGLLALDLPLAVAVAAVTLLSLGYDMTQPLFAGVVTALGGKRGGQAMGLNVFALFTGFGLASWAFGAALRLGMGAALAVFAAAQCAAALVAFPLFADEGTPVPAAPTSASGKGIGP